MNRAAFDTYVETQLAPTLQKGDVVILDNLAVHKSAKAAACLKERGAWFLFLPPYSPDLNPCMDGSCGSRMSDRFWVNWSVAAMYTASDVQRDRCAP